MVLKKSILPAIVVIYTMALVLCSTLRPCVGFQSIGRLSSIGYFRSITSTSHLFSTTTDVDDGKARILFLGTPDVAATSLKTLYEQSQSPDCPYKVVGVVTQPPKRRKRKGKEIMSPS